MTLRGIETDTMLASYLLDATRSAHPLEDLALEHAGYKALQRRGRLRPRREGGPVRATSRSIARVDYAGERADLALQMSSTLRELLRQEELRGALRDARTAARAGARRHRARRRPHRRRGARAAQSGSVDHELARLARRRSTSTPARSSTSTRRRSCRRSSSTSSGCGPRRSAARRRRRRSRRRSKCSRSWR